MGDYTEHLISMAGGDGEAGPRIIDQEKLLSTPDAAVWAREFKKVQPDIDEGFMIGWFANAMVTAERHSTIAWEQQARLDLLANQANAAEMLCRMNGGDPELAVVPAAAIRAALTATDQP